MLHTHRALKTAAVAMTLLVMVTACGSSGSDDASSGPDKSSSSESTTTNDAAASSTTDAGSSTTEPADTDDPSDDDESNSELCDAAGPLFSSKSAFLTVNSPEQIAQSREYAAAYEAMASKTDDTKIADYLTDLASTIRKAADAKNMVNVNLQPPDAKRIAADCADTQLEVSKDGSVISVSPESFEAGRVAVRVAGTGKQAGVVIYPLKDGQKPGDLFAGTDPLDGTKAVLATTVTEDSTFLKTIASGRYAIGLGSGAEPKPEELAELTVT